MDKRIKCTMTYLLRCPRSLVLEAMRARKSYGKEGKDAGKQERQQSTSDGRDGGRGGNAMATGMEGRTVT